MISRHPEVTILAAVLCAFCLVTGACSDEDDPDNVGGGGVGGTTTDGNNGAVGDAGDAGADASDVAFDAEEPNGAPIEVSCDGVQSDLEILVIDFDFDPVDATISAGDVVQWTHAGTAPHTVTSGGPESANPGSLFGSGTIQAGDRFCVRFPAPGSFDYFCELHPQLMQATLQVQ